MGGKLVLKGGLQVTAHGVEKVGGRAAPAPGAACSCSAEAASCRLGGARPVPHTLCPCCCLAQKKKKKKKQVQAEDPNLTEEERKALETQSEHWLSLRLLGAGVQAAHWRAPAEAGHSGSGQVLCCTGPDWAGGMPPRQPQPSTLMCCSPQSCPALRGGCCADRPCREGTDGGVRAVGQDVRGGVCT